MDFKNKRKKEPASVLLDELLEFYDGDDWLVVKKYILRYSHPDIRKKFSTRNAITKKHTLNEFEKKLIKYCFDTYKVNLILYEKDKHYD